MDEFKFDDGKLRFDLIPAEVLESLAEIYTYGFEKYAKPQGKHTSDWDKVSVSRYEGAMMRHYTAWKKGEDIDSESGYHHLKHMFWNAGALVALICYRMQTNKKDHSSCNCPDCRYMS